MWETEKERMCVIYTYEILICEIYYVRRFSSYIKMIIFLMLFTLLKFRFEELNIFKLLITHYHEKNA